MAETQPRTFGRYTVERELGRGGMGIVYAATHEVLGRHAAIKVLINDVSRDSEAVDRFINEARAASAIQHPSIVQVYEVEHAGDAVYIVMELLQGESLASRLKSRGAMPIATAVGLARQCANALEAAHRAGIVHRDLKPDNVFLVPDAEVLGGERVKLLDFGVAKLVGDGTSSVARTVTGAILGTPHYMSPEQCEGAREVDPRSDLYSLGCMLFQMVAGRLPFNSAGIGGLIGMHLHVEPPLLRTMRPDAPPELEELISRLLAKSPDDRVQTATEVAEWLVEVPGVPTRLSSPTAPPSALPPVETGSATVVTMVPIVDSVRVTEKAPLAAPVAKRRRRWIWPAIALGAIAIAAVAFFAFRDHSDDPQLARSIPTPTPPPTLPTPIPTPPTPPPPTRSDPELVDGWRLLAQRDFKGAREHLAKVTNPDDAAELEKALHEAEAKDKETIPVVVIKPTPQPKPKPRTQPQTVAQTPVQPDEKQRIAEREARRVEDLLRNIRAPNANAGVVSSACMTLFYTDKNAVPWERCITQSCKFNVNAGRTMIRVASPHLQRGFYEYCPEAAPPGVLPPRPTRPN